MVFKNSCKKPSTQSVSSILFLRLSLTSSLYSLLDIEVLEYPEITKLCGKAPDVNKIYKEGKSLVNAKLPEAPRITIELDSLLIIYFSIQLFNLRV